MDFIETSGFLSGASRASWKKNTVRSIFACCSQIRSTSQELLYLLSFPRSPAKPFHSACCLNCWHSMLSLVISALSSWTFCWWLSIRDLRKEEWNSFWSQGVKCATRVMPKTAKGHLRSTKCLANYFSLLLELCNLQFHGNHQFGTL